MWLDAIFGWLEDWGYFVSGLLLFVASISLAFSALVGYGNRRNAEFCEARWAGSGYRSSYSVEAGCRILVGSKWIPESAFRGGVLK